MSPFSSYSKCPAGPDHINREPVTGEVPLNILSCNAVEFLKGIDTSRRIILLKGAISVKILVCIDGSPNSQKCAEVAAKMVDDCTVNEVTFIHVHESSQFIPDYWHGKYPFTDEEKEQINKLDKRVIESRKKVFNEALKLFEGKNVKVDTIFKIGHPAEVIAHTAEAGGFDMVVIGRRGSGGVKKLFMGSVSSTVLQLIKTNILIVK